MHLPNPRKRLLLPSSLSNIPSSTSPRTSPNGTSKRARTASPLRMAHGVESEVGRLVTRDEAGVRVLLLTLSTASFTLGRSAACDYQLTLPASSASPAAAAAKAADRVPNSRASARHARVYCLTADTGEHLATLQDLQSTNGTLHNGRLVSRGGSVVLSEGDRVEIAGQVFRYTHTAASPSSSSAAAVAAFEAEQGAQTKQIGNFLVSPRTLGSGAFSEVYLALSTVTLKQVACKRLARSRLSSSSAASGKKGKERDRLGAIQREIEMLKKASHPNINKIEDVVVRDEAVVSGGDLFSYLVKRTRLDAPEAKFILYQLLLGLRYLHEEVNVAHRDIKLENVILSTAGPFPQVQLADFGQSRSCTSSFRSLNGTLQYMAPEQLVAWTRKGGYSGKRADCWSLPFTPSSSASSTAGGLLSVFGASAAGELSTTPSDLPVCRAVVEGKVALGVPGRGGFGSGDYAARALLAHLLSHDPLMRATASEALQSPWIESSRKELEALYAKVVVG
ncbi:hypothetical protein JCM10213v2_003463 [Rhodosporidiobolus nylandii]